MKSIIQLSSAFLSLLLITSCAQIDFEDRWEGPLLVANHKNVLVEDFTGQKCPNCPLAQVEIEKLQTTYGAKHIIAVALHGGAQALDESTSQFIGLATEESKTYNRRLGNFSYPKGCIDRQANLLDVEKWNAAVADRISLTPKAQLAIHVQNYDAESRQLSFSIAVEAFEQVNGEVQLWLTESGIKALQFLPREWGGGYREDYVHNHVFRAAINGLDGQHVSLMKDDTFTEAYTFTLNANWNPEHMALVLIYANATDGVIEVIDTPILNQSTH